MAKKIFPRAHTSYMIDWYSTYYKNNKYYSTVQVLGIENKNNKKTYYLTHMLYENEDVKINSGNTYIYEEGNEENLWKHFKLIKESMNRKA